MRSSGSPDSMDSSLRLEQPAEPAGPAEPAAAAPTPPSRFNRLPPEVLVHIFDHILPTIHPSSSTYPNPRLNTLDNSFTLPSSTVFDLCSASLVCRVWHDLATEALWRAPVLKNLRSIRRFSEAISRDASASESGQSEKAKMIRALSLPPSDGLLDAQDLLADLEAYQGALRIIFTQAVRIDCISLGHRPSGAAFAHFFNPATKALPRNVTLNNLSFSAPPFLNVSLAPLQRVTHLHLIKVVPPSALLSFLCGRSIDDARVPPAISPAKTLTHLRLSLLPSDSLLLFQHFVDWRARSDEYEALPPQVRAHAPVPRAPDAPARRFSVQEALFRLATTSDALENLQVLILEHVALEPLESPETVVTGPDFYMANENVINAEGTVDIHGALSTTNYPIDAPVAFSEDARAAEIARTEQRDQYWAHVAAGKRALCALWRRAVDIRIVASRPGGHDKYESTIDFLCQSGCFGSPDGGSWDDPDVFDLAETRPDLATKDGWWTGELPRLKPNSFNTSHHDSSE